MSQATAAPANADGLVSLPSSYPVGETLDRLESLLRAKGATIFTRIDHEAAARGAGLTMRPAQVLIFGNPRIGTPVMNATPTIAIDLPFKALAWEDETGRTWLSYNSTEYLARRHGVHAHVIQPLTAVAGLIAAAVRP